MFNQKKFWYKKCFAKKNNDSRIKEMLYSVKLKEQELLMVKKVLDFPFSIKNLTEF